MRTATSSCAIGIALSFIVVAAAVVHGGVLTGRGAKADPTPCALHLNQKSCQDESSCLWCGKIANQTEQHTGGFCYSNREPGKCCAVAPAQPSFFCQPVAMLCSPLTVCVTGSSNTDYGPCPFATCCPPDKSVACNGQCMSENSRCCGEYTCTKPNTCCGSWGGGGACCVPGGSCCTAPDGEANWCCGPGSACTISPYFGCTNSTPFPVEIARR